MKDLADEPQDDFAVVMIADQLPILLETEEEAARLYECQYCGHYPCGCGG